MRRAFLLSSAMLLAACGSNEGAESNVAQNAAPAAEDSAAAANPEELATTGLYPGSRPAAARDTYVTDDPMDRVVAWYRDDASRRAQGLTFSSERRPHHDYLVVGNDLNQLKSFIIHVLPGRSGGTELRLYPFDYLAKGGKLEDPPSS